MVKSSGVFMLLASACWLASSRYNPHAKPRKLGKTGVLSCQQMGGEKSPFTLKDSAKVSADLSFSQRLSLFFLWMRCPTSCFGLLGVSAFLKIYFYCIYLAQISVAILNSLSDQYSWVRNELPYPPHLWIKQYHSCSFSGMALALNNPWRLICH